MKGKKGAVEAPVTPLGGGYQEALQHEEIRTQDQAEAPLSLQDSHGIVWIVAYRGLSGAVEADPTVWESFQDAMAMAVEMVEEDPSADPTLIQVVIDPDLIRLALESRTR